MLIKPEPTSRRGRKRSSNSGSSSRKKKKQKEKQRKGQDSPQQPDGKHIDGDDHDAEHQWRRSRSREADKHHGAYGKSDGQTDDQANGAAPQQKSEYERLRERYSPEEITLLRYLQHEKDLIVNLCQNGGDLVSPAKTQCENTSIEIDEVDAMTPDNWIPRSENLIRRTGQHPLNAEPRLQVLYDAGLITPNELHNVRSHGSVPRLYWDTHVLDVCGGKLKLTMDDLKNQFD